jgi:cell division protein FtsQ
MLRKFDYSQRWLSKILWLLVFLFGVGMAESRVSTQQCDNLLVNVDYDSGVRFINQSDVENLLTVNGRDPLHGSKQKNIQLDVLEKRVRANKLVRDCQIYHDLAGNLVVDIEQEQPVARWINSAQNGGWHKASGFYINGEGDFIPLSDRYSARVLMVAGSFFKNRPNLRSAQDAPVLNMIKHVQQDPFWQAQVVQMDVSKEGEIHLLTALGNQRIEFGKAENIEAKLTKLRIFYQKVMTSDWSRYSRISLKYHDQIVCE